MVTGLLFEKSKRCPENPTFTFVPEPGDRRWQPACGCLGSVASGKVPSDGADDGRERYPPRLGRRERRTGIAGCA